MGLKKKTMTIAAAFTFLSLFSLGVEGNSMHLHPHDHQEFLAPFRPHSGTGGEMLKEEGWNHTNPTIANNYNGVGSPMFSTAYGSNKNNGSGHSHQAGGSGDGHKNRDTGPYVVD